VVAPPEAELGYLEERPWLSAMEMRSNRRALRPRVASGMIERWGRGGERKKRAGEEKRGRKEAGTRVVRDNGESLRETQPRRYHRCSRLFALGLSARDSLPAKSAIGFNLRGTRDEGRAGPSL